MHNGCRFWPPFLVSSLHCRTTPSTYINGNVMSRENSSTRYLKNSGYESQQIIRIIEATSTNEIQRGDYSIAHAESIMWQCLGTISIRYFPGGTTGCYSIEAFLRSTPCRFDRPNLSRNLLTISEQRLGSVIVGPFARPVFRVGPT